MGHCVRLSALALLLSVCEPPDCRGAAGSGLAGHSAPTPAHPRAVLCPTQRAAPKSLPTCENKKNPMSHSSWTSGQSDAKGGLGRVLCLESWVRTFFWAAGRTPKMIWGTDAAGAEAPRQDRARSSLAWLEQETKEGFINGLEVRPGR